MLCSMYILKFTLLLWRPRFLHPLFHILLQVLPLTYMFPFWFFLITPIIHFASFQNWILKYIHLQQYDNPSVKIWLWFKVVCLVTINHLLDYISHPRIPLWIPCLHSKLFGTEFFILSSIMIKSSYLSNFAKRVLCEYYIWKFKTVFKIK